MVWKMAAILSRPGYVNMINIADAAMRHEINSSPP